MATIIADNIITPLGFTAEENLDAIVSGRSGLRRHEPTAALPFAFTASMFSDEMMSKIESEGFSRFESLALASITRALADCQVPMDERTVFILSSTKGNIGDYDGGDRYDDILLTASASKLAKAIGVKTEPMTVCNACVSGVSALILADRLIAVGAYDYAIVCGADVQSPFIISGFHSLKALDANQCKPFDIERLGLNLGEAAATVVLSRDGLGADGEYRIVAGCSRNDGFHITNPAPTGEGAMQALKAVIDAGGNIDDLAAINAHGTATMFNDQMESKAISRAGLSDTPVNALKANIGHTMGAAGIVETILTLHAIERGIVLGTKGFTEIGVSGKINISADNRPTDKRSFAKIISGFGGCNSAILLSKSSSPDSLSQSTDYAIGHHVRITSRNATVDGKDIVIEGESGILTAIYKSRINDYPKYYKMDSLSRLAFVATELLLQAEGADRLADSDNLAIVFFSKSGSIKTDAAYIETFTDPQSFFPSPSLFVYTLPNITTGEVAIRNRYHGETLFIMLESRDSAAIDATNRAMLCDQAAKSLISGWIEYTDDLNFEADIYLINK